MAKQGKKSRLKRALKWAGYIYLWIMLCAVLVFVGGGLVYWHDRAKLSGVVALKGLQGEVTIMRDPYGVAHIVAQKSDLDAFFALGYAHAQDRFWQMEFGRHVVQGRLSEMFGKGALNQDKYLRTWGFYRAAQEAWPALSPQAKQIIESYTAGVNAYIQQKHFPLEIYIFSDKPEPWTVIDSIAWQKMLAWDLQNSWERKLKYTVVAKTFGASQVFTLLPSYPDNAPVILSNADLRQSGLSAGLLPENKNSNKNIDNMDKGSNNWVVSGRFTASGKPLLANDPHLSLQAPSVWYLAELKGPTLHVTGATLPGVPGVVIGHNDHIAWGVTNVNPDTQDLYILPKGARVAEHDEVVKVRGDYQLVDFPVFESDVGPVISPVTPARKIGEWVALKWTALQPNDTTVQSMLEIDYAQNWSQFVKALKDFVVPSQNFVYADTQGNIGYYVPGKIPVRHWNADGAVPDDAAHQWSGFVPFDKLPHVYNPPEGMIVSANNLVAGSNYLYQTPFLHADAPYRATRILTLLHEAGVLDRDKFANIQLDTHSDLWQSLKPLLLKTQPLDNQSREALDLLKNWDGNMTMNSVPATIFAFWYQKLADLTPPALAELSRWPDPLFIHDELLNNGTYCERKDAANCSIFLSKSLQIAMQKLTQQLGDKPDKWQWSRVHKAGFSALGLGGIRIFAPLWNRSIQTPGGLYTVNVGTYDINNFTQEEGASYRQIVDLGNLNQSVFMQPLGQSGDPLAKHYADLMPLWRDGKYLPMSGDKAGGGRREQVLKLVP